MFLSRLFKNARSKVMIALAGLTMVFGTAAAITTVAATQENEVVETKADISDTNTKMYYVGDKWHIWVWKSSDETHYDGGKWPGAEMNWFSLDGTDHRWYDPGSASTAADKVIFSKNNGSVETPTRDYSYLTPFYNDSGAISAGTLLSYKLKSEGYGTSHPFSFDQSSRSLTVTTDVLQANECVKFSVSTFRTTENGGSSDGDHPTLDGMEWDSTEHTFKVTNRATFTWSITYAHYVNYGNWTFGISSLPTRKYAITFGQNDLSPGDSVTKTEYKTHDVSYTIPSISDLGMSPNGGRHFVKWNTARDGNGTTHGVGTSYTVNADLTLFLIQDWYSYKVSFDGGSTWTDMVETEDKPAGYAKQFSLSAAQILTSGSSLTFQKYDGSAASSITPGTITGNYNAGTIRFTTSGNIFVKVKDTGVIDVYVEGAGHQVVVTHSGVSTVYATSKVASDDYDYTTIGISIYPGDTVKPAYDGGDPYNFLQIDAGDGSFTLSGGSALSDSFGVFKIHLISAFHNAEFNNARFEENEESSANFYARTFNSAISSVCTGIKDSGNSPSTLVTPWGDQATYYSKLTSDASELVVPSGASPAETDIDLCIEKYDYVCGKYGPNGQKITGITDFMGRNPPKPASAGIIPNTSKTESPLTTTLWIVLGSGLAGLAAIGTAYFVSKKKKRYNA